MNSAKLTFLTVVLILLLPKVYSKGCEKSGDVWTCRDIQLETNKILPITDLNLSVKSIKFENCIIPTVPSGVFISFNNVKDIDLENSKIHDIEPGAFNRLTRLNKLHLRNNGIAEIKVNVFNPLINVKELNLHYNNINKLENECFSNMTNLEVLRLGWNKLTYIPQNVFVGLKNLKYLFLNNNQISRLAVGSFRDLPALYQLNLEKNLITQLEFGTFSRTSSLSVLALSFNNLSKINEDVFNEFSNLNTLYINENNLTFLNFEKLLVHTPKLNKIYLNNNTWPCNLLFGSIQTFKIHNVVIADNSTVLVNNLRGIKCIASVEATTESNANFEKFEKSLTKKLSDLNFFKDIHSSLFNSTTDYINLIFLKHFEQGFKNTTLFKFFQHDFENSSFFKGFESNFLKLLNEVRHSQENFKTISLKTPKSFNETSSLPYFTNGIFINVCIIIIILLLLVGTGIQCCTCLQRRKTFLINEEALL